MGFASMKKLYLGFKLLSFILLVSAGNAQGMEIIPSFFKPLSNIFSSLSSPCISSSTNHKSKKANTKKLKTNKNNFEQALNSLKNDGLAEKARLSVVSTLYSEDYDLCYFNSNAKRILTRVENNPNSFLLYCYYQKFHDNWDRDDIDFLITPKHADLFTRCKNVRIEGYSALSAAIMAKDLAVASKHDFIQKLIDNGFELTEKDTLLAASELYDGILTEQKTSVLDFLLGQGNFSVLPLDVRRYTMQYVIDAFKETLWPLCNVQPKQAV